MNAITVVRLYYLATAALLVGWLINLYEALTRPTINWRDAMGVQLLVIIFVTLIMLARVRRNVLADQAAFVRIGAGRYIVAGLAAAGLVVAVLLGLRTHG